MSGLESLEQFHLQFKKKMNNDELRAMNRAFVRPIIPTPNRLKMSMSQIAKAYKQSTLGNIS